jgi:predicted RNA-binding Zn ribbon-like protein
MTLSGRFHFVGEQLCLDFINTEVVQNDDRVDLLSGFDDLMAWFTEAQVIDAAQAKTLMRRIGRGDGGDGARALKEARQFRATVREMVERLAEGKTNVSPAALDHLNRLLRAREGYSEMVRRKDGYDLRFRPRIDEPAHLLVAVAESAARLLTEGDAALLRKCGNPRCILYFYDTTKNHRRRWCSMAGCGNRAKVAAYYQRNREDADEDD